MDLKSFYYLDHFEEVLAFIGAHCGHLLRAEHHDFIERYRQLRRDDRALLVRMIHRKGWFFRRQTLRYTELESPAAALERLGRAELARPLRADDIEAFLPFLTKAELLDVRNQLQLPLDGYRSRQKHHLIESLLSEADHRSILTSVDADSWVTLVDPTPCKYLLFVYFGRQRGDGMTAFAMRDLGLLREGGSRAAVEAAFDSREAAEHAFFYAKIREQTYAGHRSAWERLADQVASWPRLDREGEDVLHHKAIERLGRCLERADRADLAHNVYAQTSGFPAIERYCRLAFAAGQAAEVEARLKAMIENPSCDEALLFAEDFYARKFSQRRVGRLTRQLREARQIDLDDTFRGMPEFGVISKLRQAGETVLWTENAFWRTCFACFFWDELFGPEGSTRASEFDLLPSCLQQNRFYDDHADRIEAKLRAYDADHFARSVEALRIAHREDADGFIPWNADLVEHLPACVQTAPPGAMESILRAMAKDFRGNSAGFPDLMILDPDGPRWVEVKSEGDQIHRRQLMQLQRLQTAGFRAEVLRVRWSVDPDQTYAVVDVETTGGRSSSHRLTEIAVVKVRGGRIVDQFQTLLNPERPIPGFITRLTGISDNMVADAPRFAGIHDRLLGFLGDSVFVAHNAKFDYGFVRSEFARAGTDFRRPSLCTVAESRRHFPGLKSYGLKALSQHFQIPLESHHRALCDASATAELLLKINAQRAKRRGKAAPQHDEARAGRPLSRAM